MNIVSGLSESLALDRFSYRLKLIRACPVHQYAYATGMLVAGVGRALVNALLVLAFAPLLGIHVHFDLWFVPVVILAAVSLAGLGLIIATWSPNQETANAISNVAGVFVVLMSPVYYPVSRLPDWLEPIARLSPYTYAAQALTKILSGTGDFAGDMTILAAITAAGLAIGMRSMRWRET
jgi:ABC-2 type transport system permease protein